MDKVIWSAGVLQVWCVAHVVTMDSEDNPHVEFIQVIGEDYQDCMEAVVSQLDEDERCANLTFKGLIEEFKASVHYNGGK